MKKTTKTCITSQRMLNSIAQKSSSHICSLTCSSWTMFHGTYGEFTNCITWSRRLQCFYNVSAKGSRRELNTRLVAVATLLASLPILAGFYPVPVWFYCFGVPCLCRQNITTPLLFGTALLEEKAERTKGWTISVAQSFKRGIAFGHGIGKTRTSNILAKR